MKRLGLGVLVLSSLLILRCGELSPRAASPFSPGGGNVGTTGAAGPGDGPGSGGGPMLPPEEELEEDFRVPVATGRFVWTANPDSNRVALIDAKTFGVVTLDAGFGPNYLTALPTTAERSGAAVINTLSADATFFLARDIGDVITSDPVPVHPQANAWVVSASGRWAIAWTNAGRIESTDPTQGFQDVTVIDLEGYPEQAPRATRVSVGYRPARVVISDDEQQAFVVTEPGISVIDLASEAGPVAVRDIVVADTPAAEVAIGPNGRWALVRLPAAAQLNLVDLETAELRSLPLPGVVTDLDLSPDASQAVAVIRGMLETDSAPDGLAGAGGRDGSAGAAGASGQDSVHDSTVVILPIPGIFSDPTEFSKVRLPELVGSVVVPPSGEHVLLFTNAIESDRVTLLNTREASWRTIELKAPVRALFATEDGAHAVGLLAPPAGSTRRGAFSLIPVVENLPPKLQGTLAPTLGVAIDNHNAIITTRDATGQYQAFLAGFPSLRVDPVELPSAPTASGMVREAGLGFIAQEHAEGRITFVNLEDANARTLTGFELGLKVVDGD